MRLRALAILPILVLWLATSLGACASAPPRVAAFATGDRAAIAAVLDRQVSAWNHADLASYMDGYARTPQLVFTSGGDIRRGWQDAFDHYQARYATNPGAMGALAFRVDTIDPVGAGGAVVLGYWELTGGAHPARGVFTLVFERRPEGWRIIHDHTSVARDPTAPP
jgi:ketosteroid isomerase-like protein